MKAIIKIERLQRQEEGETACEVRDACESKCPKIVKYQLDTHYYQHNSKCPRGKRLHWRQWKEKRRRLAESTYIDKIAHRLDYKA